MTSEGLPKETILAVFYPETEVETLRETREAFRRKKENPESG